MRRSTVKHKRVYENGGNEAFVPGFPIEFIPDHFDTAALDQSLPGRPFPDTHEPTHGTLACTLAFSG